MTVDLEVLRETVEKLLCSRGLFDIDSFGWLNENDEDPEYIGYVMWALSPPYEHDFESWQNKTPPNREPADAEQRLMELGHDFFGLMKTARHFIGLALLHQPAVRPIRFEPTEFDFNEFGALAALTAASDRLSDFIIVTTLGKKANEEGERNKACDKLRDSGFVIEADAVQEGFNSIGKARKQRNKAAHGLATRPAHVQRALIAADREAFEKQRGLAASSRKMPDEDDVEARAKLLCDCYQGLIKMGEVSFRTEHNWRHAPLSRTVI
jgi:hypothetical protein